MAGKVILVGAGPGDAGLLTEKGRREIERAEVVLFDRLVDDENMKLIAGSAEKIDVGKRVVRLKGGDCFVFGRGGEELELLSEAGVDFEVVPGITSALAAAAYAGIPATYRDFCSSVHIITGHRRRSEALSMDFDALVRLNGTLIFLMAVATFGEIAEGLMEAGMSADFPCTIVENGTRPEQRKLLTTVSKAAQCIAENEVKSPAIFVVGRVCELSERMDWFDRLPLKGKRVMVAKLWEDGHRLADLLRENGARVIELPAPKTEYLPFELPETGANLILSSAEAVNALFAQLNRMGKDAHTLAGYALVCETADAEKALKERGLRPDEVNVDRSTVRLCREGENGLAVWRRILPDAVSQIDAEIVAFTTLSGIEAFESLSQEWDFSRMKAVCIGEKTAAAAGYGGCSSGYARTGIHGGVNEISKGTAVAVPLLICAFCG